jgi:hypothetical protein
MATVTSFEKQNYDMFDTISIGTIFITLLERPRGNVHAHGSIGSTHDSTDTETVSGMLPTLRPHRAYLGTPAARAYLGTPALLSKVGHIRLEFTLGHLRCQSWENKKS